MQFAPETSYPFFHSQQGLMISVNQGFLQSIEPLVWYSPLLLNPQINFGFSTYPHYSTLYQPPQILQAHRTQNPLKELAENKHADEIQQKNLFALKEETGIKSSSNLMSQKLTQRRSRKCDRKKVIKKSQKKSLQDPRRNIVTNIGNQLLTFTTNKSKCLKILEIASNTIDQKELSGFFTYTKRIKSRIGYYLNYAKMRKIWFPKEINSSFKSYQRILRTISYVYLNHVFRSIILNSTKMKKTSKFYHMKAVRKLLRDLRSPPTAY